MCWHGSESCWSSGISVSHIQVKLSWGQGWGSIWRWSSPGGWMCSSCKGVVAAVDVFLCLQSETGHCQGGQMCTAAAVCAAAHVAAAADEDDDEEGQSSPSQPATRYQPLM